MEVVCNVLLSVFLGVSSFLGFLYKTGFYGSFFAAIFFALLVFFIKEYLNPAKDISGDFFVYSKTKSSSYNPYADMVIERNIIIFSDGRSVKGSSEKTREKQINKNILEYKHHDRVRATIDGYIERRYVRPSKLHLHLIEDNTESRTSTIYIQIDLGWRPSFNKNKKGHFYSTAADSKGDVLLCRNRCDLDSI